LLIRDPTMQELLERTVDTTTVYFEGKERTADTVLTKSAEHCACILECTDALGALCDSSLKDCCPSHRNPESS